MNLFQLADAWVTPYRDNDLEQLLRVGAFCLMRQSGKFDKQGKPIMRETTIKERETDHYINPALEGSEFRGSEPQAMDEYDALAIDGFPGTRERIEGLARYYDENGAKEDRRGNELTSGKSPCILNDAETADRLIDNATRWIELPESSLTPFQRAIIALAAEEMATETANRQLPRSMESMKGRGLLGHKQTGSKG